MCRFIVIWACFLDIRPSSMHNLHAPVKFQQAPRYELALQDGADYLEQFTRGRIGT